MFRRAIIPLIVAVLASTAGCDAKPSGPPTAKLEGAVSVDGKPVEKGVVQFLPDDKTAAKPVQGMIAAGRYAIPNAPLGKGRFVVTATRETGKMNKEYSQPFPEVVSIVPEQYRDGIPATVEKDNSALNFDLKSAK